MYALPRQRNEFRFNPMSFQHIERDTEQGFGIPALPWTPADRKNFHDLILPVAVPMERSRTDYHIPRNGMHGVDIRTFQTTH